MIKKREWLAFCQNYMYIICVENISCSVADRQPDKEAFAVLEIVEISKAYRGRQVLPRISFRLPAGQCLGLVGENGAGKSTLMRLIAQVERPDSGDIRFEGRSILGKRSFLRDHVGYVPQGNDLMPDLTARQQLKLWQSACGIKGDLPGDLIELLELQPLLDTVNKELSGGMQRRVSIAMALLNRPKILIMDEATTGLDRDNTARLLDYMEYLLSQGTSVLWCSHHQEEIKRLCGSSIKL